MSQLDQRFTMAISRNQDLLEVLTALTESGHQSGGRFAAGQLATRLEVSQGSAREADRELLLALDGELDSCRQLPRMREYRALLRLVAERNQVLLERVRTQRALVAAELTELRGAKLAVAGYRAPVEARGRSLSESY